MCKCKCKCRCKWLIYVGIGLLAVLFLSPFVCGCCRDCLIEQFGFTSSETTKDFYSTWITGFGIFGIVGTVCGIINNIKNQRKQLQNQDYQLENQQNQLQNQEKGLRDQRFKDGVSLLGHESESVRIGGAYNLYFLAQEYPRDYLQPVCEILCAHLVLETNKPEYQAINTLEPSKEVQAILDFLFGISYNVEKASIFDDYEKNLDTVWLSGAIFNGRRVKNVRFCKGATIQHSNFIGAFLNGVNFSYAKITDADFTFSHMDYNCSFNGAEIRKSGFDNAKIDKDASFYKQKGNMKMCKMDKDTFDTIKNLISNEQINQIDII